MSDKIIALTGPAALATTATTVFTNVSGDEVLVRHARFSNTAGASATVNLSVGTDATGTRIVPGKLVAANDSLDVFFNPGIPLTGTQTLQAFASAVTVNLAVWGTKRYV
jgi:hypothetical protein